MTHRAFHQEDANIYTTLASQVAVALQNARLYVEQAATVTQLRELDRLKSSFLANMSHELRTPLNSILGFADVMLEELDGPLTENMDNDLRLIQKNGQHLLHLINDVLDMAKIEAGRMNLAPEKFMSTKSWMKSPASPPRWPARRTWRSSSTESPIRKVEMFADRTRLRQVMINLVNNAIKFTEKGKISLKVEPMEETRVLITVKDTGIGIPPDKLETIFQEFTQVDTSTTRKAGGTGLGLPISRRLVEMHGGRLWAESTGVNGEGSVFYVELPIEATHYRSDREDDKVTCANHVFLECNLCGQQQPYEPFVPAVCKKCDSQWLEARYDYNGFKREILRGLPGAPPTCGATRISCRSTIPASLDLYPAGGTPLWLSQRFARDLKLDNLYIKDERYGPTSSFKDRQAAVAVAAMSEGDIREAVIASTGNAAVAYAAACARAGIKLWVFMTSLVPQEKLREAALFGAEVIRVSGNYDQTKQIAAQFAQRSISCRPRRQLHPGPRVDENHRL